MRCDAQIPYVRNAFASVNVVQKILEEARPVNGLYHLEQKEEKQ
jgi:hypothetical protein